MQTPTCEYVPQSIEYGDIEFEFHAGDFASFFGHHVDRLGDLIQDQRLHCNFAEPKVLELLQTKPTLFLPDFPVREHDSGQVPVLVWTHELVIGTYASPVVETVVCHGLD